MLLLVAPSQKLSAATYQLDVAQTNLGGGIAVWDVQDGLFAGTLTLTSTNTANINLAESALPQFRYNQSLPSSYEFVYTASAMSAGGDSEIDTFSLSISTTQGGEFFFGNANTSLVSGDATYGAGSDQSGDVLVVGDSGSSQSNSFISTGSEFEIVGEGAAGSTFGWQTGMFQLPPNPDNLPIFFPPAVITFDVTLAAASVPEPSSIFLVALSGVALGLRRKRSGLANL